MTQHKVELAGKTVNILSLHHGFSILMRVLLIFIGLLASVFPKPPESSLARFKTASIIMAQLADFIPVHKVLFPVPVIFSAVASVFYFISLRSKSVT